MVVCGSSRASSAQYPVSRAQCGALPTSARTDAHGRLFIRCPFHARTQRTCLSARTAHAVACIYMCRARPRRNRTPWDSSRYKYTRLGVDEGGWVEGDRPRRLCVCVYIYIMSLYEDCSSFIGRLRLRKCVSQSVFPFPSPPSSRVGGARRRLRAGVGKGTRSAAALVLASTSMFCRTDSDCSLNGLCTAGICACDTPWAGNRCQTLQLAVGLLGLHDIPLCAYHGDGPNSTSWGALHARSMYTACMQAVRCCVHALCALHVRCMRTACKWYSCAPPIRSCSCACRRFGAACAGGRQVLHVGSLDD